VADVVAPEHTNTWYPIPHETLITRVEGALDTLGMKVTESAHALSKGGDRYFGLLKVSNGQEEHRDYSYILGLRNSHDRKFTASMVVGSQVFVCDNLAFSGEITIARKHTRHIERDLPLLAVQAVGKLNNKWADMDKRISLYKESYVTDIAAHDFIIRSVDAGALPVTKVPEVLREWRTPTHQEFASNKTAWRLFNAFTEASKGVSLATLPQRTISLHALMDAQVGYTNN
jgi:hypothetical protein